MPCYSAPTHKDRWCFPLSQRFLKFRSEVKCKGPFRFFPTGLLAVRSTYFDRTGPIKICRSIFDKPVYCPYSPHLFREIEKGIENVRKSENAIVPFVSGVGIMEAPRMYHNRALCPFLAGIFRGSGSQARKVASHRNSSRQQAAVYASLRLGLCYTTSS